MLSAHQRLAIRARLPEVDQVYIRDERDIVDLSFLRLAMSDGSTIVVYGLREDGSYRCRRTRERDGSSDRLLDEPIPAEMQYRLVAVFGRLRFGSE